jgi:hypothetical protein
MIVMERGCVEEAEELHVVEIEERFLRYASRRVHRK